jgi:ribosomal protein S21
VAEVRIDRAEDFEKAFRQFKIQTKREGVLEEYRERQYYSKPSKKRRKNVKRKRP